MKNELYSVVEGYIKPWTKTSEKSGAMKELQKLDETGKMFYSKPSSIALALIYRNKDKGRTYAEIIKEFEDIHKLYNSVVTVRKHVRDIGGLLDSKVQV